MRCTFVLSSTNYGQMVSSLVVATRFNVPAWQLGMGTRSGEARGEEALDCLAMTDSTTTALQPLTPRQGVHIRKILS